MHIHESICSQRSPLIGHVSALDRARLRLERELVVEDRLHVLAVCDGVQYGNHSDLLTLEE